MKLPPREFSRRHAVLLAFTLLYSLVFGAWILSIPNYEFLFHVLAVLALVGVVSALHLRCGLSLGLLWMLSLWGFFHLAGGLIPLPAGWPYSGDHAVFYSLWFIPNYLRYDHVIHAYGFGAATWLCWQLLRAGIAGAASPTPARLQATWGILSLCALGGIGLGGVNEMVEFIITRIVPETNIGGYENTSWDLISNLAGATAAAVLIRLRATRTRTS